MVAMAVFPEIICILWVDHYRFTWDVTIRDTVLIRDSILAILTSGFLQSLLSLLNAVLDGYIDQKDDTASSDDASNDQSDLGITAHIVTTVTIAITIASTTS